MDTQQRHSHIIDKLAQYERLGIVSTVLVQHDERIGVKWIFTPAGHAECSLLTSQVEDFILGVDAALSSEVWPHRAEEWPDNPEEPPPATMGVGQ